MGACVPQVSAPCDTIGAVMPSNWEGGSTGAYIGLVTTCAAAVPSGMCDFRTIEKCRDLTSEDGCVADADCSWCSDVKVGIDDDGMVGAESCYASEANCKDSWKEIRFFSEASVSMTYSKDACPVFSGAP